jgi:hypothetical protein
LPSGPFLHTDHSCAIIESLAEKSLITIMKIDRSA